MLTIMVANIETKTKNRFLSFLLFFIKRRNFTRKYCLKFKPCKYRKTTKYIFFFKVRKQSVQNKIAEIKHKKLKEKKQEYPTLEDNGRRGNSIPRT